MSTSAWSVVVMLTVVFFHSGGHCLTCDDPMELTTGVCGKLSKDFERALLEDEGNLFRIRRLFFHSPTASPVLIKVVYNITFGLNFTAKHCSGEILNSTISDFKQKNITLGWTSSGVYAWFHPTVLSVMQVQSPFAFLRIIHLTLPEQRSLEAESFLWDGSYDLPTLYLNLHVTSLMCVPSEEMLESVIEDLNTLVKL